MGKDAPPPGVKQAGKACLVVLFLHIGISGCFPAPSSGFLESGTGMTPAACGLPAMLRALLLLAPAPELACGARDGDDAGAHAACGRPDRRHAGQGAGEQAWRDAEFGIPVTGVARSRFHTATHAAPPCADRRYARCSSPPPGCPQPTRRTWCGTWPAGTGRPVRRAAPAPSRGQIRPPP